MTSQKMKPFPKVKCLKCILNQGYNKVHNRDLYVAFNSGEKKFIKSIFTEFQLFPCHFMKHLMKSYLIMVSAKIAHHEYVK